MSAFDHDNILKLLGIVLESKYSATNTCYTNTRPHVRNTQSGHAHCTFYY